MAQVQIIARHAIKEGHEEEVLQTLSEFIDAARQETGNLAFDSYRKIDDHHRYVLLERYASREALDVHRSSRHFTDLLLGRIVPLLEGRTVEEYDVPD